MKKFDSFDKLAEYIEEKESSEDIEKFLANLEIPDCAYYQEKDFKELLTPKETND